MAANNQDDKSILAAHAFVNREADARIMSIHRSLLNIEGYASELDFQPAPHITLASWRVTPQELQLAETQFGDRLSGLSCTRLRAALKSREHSEKRLHYYLLPEISESLREFHAQMHRKLMWAFESYRRIDLPGSWWPHLTLFSIPSTQEPHIEQALASLREIEELSIERIGLVSYLGGARVISDIELASA